MDTDTSFRDEYPPSNLLSSKKLKKRGFLAERFVRAPISIALHFKTPIFISHLSFDTCSGKHHQSAVYEISIAPHSQELKPFEFVQVGRTNFMKNTKSCIFKNYSFPGNKLNKRSISVHRSS